MTTPSEGRGRLPGLRREASVMAGAAAALLLLCGGAGWITAGPRAGASAVGAVLLAAALQGGAWLLVARRRDAPMVAFLGAFGAAALVRLVAGVTAVALAVASGRVEPAAFLVAFAAAYAVLEVVLDVLWIRGETRSTESRRE